MSASFDQPLYEDADVKLILPTGWTKVGQSRADLLLFRDATGHRQLSLSVLTLNPPAVNPAQLEALVKSLYTHRLEAERRELANDDPVIAEGVQMHHGTPLGILSGVQRSTGRLFTGYVTAKGKLSVVLYLESIASEARVHLELANQFFRGLTIK